MKIKINKFLINLIKQNITYIITFIFLIFLFITILLIGISKINHNKKIINKLTQELNNFKQQYSPYNYDDEKKLIIEEDIKLLNMLIPNIEDYFSIIYSLERLSSETGFAIVDYHVDVINSTKNSLQLTISGIGDSKSFLNFLEKYNFAGGRLITSNKIEFDSNKNNAIKLNLTFYSKDISKSITSNIDNSYLDLDNLLEKIDKIKSKITFDFISQQDNINLNYQKKSNPFK
ncbi:MAG: hypothetical protein Fur009_3640 [Candidatus Microgenomates bacterium]